VSERTLGEGQYGGVFLATELDTRKQLACKIIDLERAMKNLGDRSVITSARERWESRIQYTSEQKRRVLREIKILAKLSHVSHKIMLYILLFTHHLAQCDQSQESFLLFTCFVSGDLHVSFCFLIFSKVPFLRPLNRRRPLFIYASSRWLSGRI
jgi:serine/threonine protein kinase